MGLQEGVVAQGLMKDLTASRPVQLNRYVANQSEATLMVNFEKH